MCSLRLIVFPLPDGLYSKSEQIIQGRCPGVCDACPVTCDCWRNMVTCSFKTCSFFNLNLLSINLSIPDMHPLRPGCPLGLEVYKLFDGIKMGCPCYFASFLHDSRGRQNLEITSPDLSPVVFKWNIHLQCKLFGALVPIIISGLADVTKSNVNEYI